nr:dsDNA nuclease domain-containing protein [Pedobacter panaciterrae]
MQKKTRMRALKPEPNIDQSIFSPDTVINGKDPGDDVLRRFRYQITFAGILCLLMVENDEYEELFCEHHEDILVKYTDQTYTGIQVKTKDLNLPPFNIEDESITKSIKRFILLETSFPGKFKNFSIVSNHGFDQSKPNLCINTLIENIKIGTDVLKPRSKTLALIKKLCLETGCDQNLAKKVIAKIRLRNYCSLNDIHMKLLNDLKNCKLLKGATESKLTQIAELIIAKCFHASSLSISDDNAILNYMTGNSGLEDIINQRIKDKCVSRNEFNSWLESEKTIPVSLLLKDRIQTDDSTEGHRRLEIKMDAGGIDAENIGSVKDFKFAFEQHSLSWIYKNPDEAESKYTQIMAVTKNLCKEIYDEKEIAKSKSNGQEMLVAVRKEIKERKKNEPAIFLDCSYEHVIGAVGVLTESCKVWWTPKFEIKE